MAIVPLNSLVESVHRDVICHSSSPPLGHVVAETCCGNALIVVSLAQPPTIARLRHLVEPSGSVLKQAHTHNSIRDRGAMAGAGPPIGRHRSGSSLKSNANGRSQALYAPRIPLNGAAISLSARRVSGGGDSAHAFRKQSFYTSHPQVMM